MPKLSVDRVPKYRRHGRDFYLGLYGSPESHEHYKRLIAEWMANGRQLPQDEEPEDLPLTVAELILAYHQHAHRYYRRADGTLTSEARRTDEAVSEWRNARRAMSCSPM